MPRPSAPDPATPGPFAQELARAAQRLGLSQQDIADRVGVSQPTVSDWMSGRKYPSRRNLRRVAEALGMTGLLPQVDSYGGNPDNGGVTSGAATDLAADVVLIPRNGTTSADADATSGGPPPASAYSRYELRRLTQADPERLYAITMPGNAMEPLIRANDTVLYVPVEDFTGAGLYVLHLDGAPIITLVQRLGGGALELIPANEPTYSREEFLPVPYPEEAEQPRTYRSQRTGLLATIEPVGRVVLYAKPI